MGLSTRLTEFLLKKAEEQPSPVLDVGFQPELPTRILDSDEPHPLGEPVSEGFASEGQTFVICYVNSQGARSTRRISMRALKRTADLRILLVARCAETQKMMGFQADRIRYCMDVNGEKYEPPAGFLAEIFGLDPLDAKLLASEGTSNPLPWPPPDQTYGLLRQQLRHELVLLVAMSESDGQVSQSETEAIIAYVEERAKTLGIELEENRIRMLQGFIRRLRPTEDQIKASIEDVAARSSKAQVEILEACTEIMLADGEVHAAERALLEQIRADLLRG
jgi:tellurite resistance protein